MQADPASTDGKFTTGLLDPAASVPSSVKGGSQRRFGVYRNNVTVGLVRAMEANFPVVRRLLGAKYFAGFAREYVQKNPPRSPLMFQYGADFAQCLESDGDLQAFPYLSDLARLEQQVRLSYHEADTLCLAADDLTQMPEHDLMQVVLRPHPAMAVIASSYAIHSIYRANRSDRVEPVADASEPQAVLVTRPRLDVEMHRLSIADLIFVRALASALPLGEAANRAYGADQKFDLANAIALLLTSGAFQSIRTKKD